MKVIFLDIDGVLNCASTKDYFDNYVGIEEYKTRLLALLVQSTDARIVLVSSWKDWWERDDKSIQHEGGDYLDMRLQQCNIAVFDKTTDNVLDRAKGIKSWLNTHDVESFVILDDEQFDYEKEGLTPYVVKTNYKKGLQKDNVLQAYDILTKNQGIA